MPLTSRDTNRMSVTGNESNLFLVTQCCETPTDSWLIVSQDEGRYISVTGTDIPEMCLISIHASSYRNLKRILHKLAFLYPYIQQVFVDFRDKQQQDLGRYRLAG